MVATCSGCNGAPCGCQQFIPRHGKPLKCSGCKHPKSFHPPTATEQGESSTAPAPRKVDQILEQYGGLDRIRPKTSVGDARKETNAGLKSRGELEHPPQGVKATQFRPKSKSRKASGSKALAQDKRHKIGRVILFPNGLNSDGELVQTKEPRPKDCEILRKQGLLLVKDPMGGDLEFGETWSQKAIDEWLRGLFAKAFEWLDARFGCPDQDENEYQWVLLQRDRTDLFVVQREIITGDDLRGVMGTTGRRWQDRCIRIAPAHVIPPSACEDFDLAIEQAYRGEAQSDESDGELSDSTKRKRRAKVQQKMQGLDSLRSSSAPALSLPISRRQRPKPRPANKGRKATSLPDLDCESSIDFPTVDDLFSVDDPTPAVTNNPPDVKGKGPATVRRSKRLARSRISTTPESSDTDGVEIVDHKLSNQSAANTSKGKGKGRAIEVSVDITTDDEAQSDRVRSLKRPASASPSPDLYAAISPFFGTPIQLRKKQRIEEPSAPQSVNNTSHGAPQSSSSLGMANANALAGPSTSASSALAPWEAVMLPAAEPVPNPFVVNITPSPPSSPTIGRGFIIPGTPRRNPWA